MPGQKPTLYVSRPLLQLQSGNAPQELINDVLQISVEESIHLPAMFTLVVHNTYDSARKEDKPWLNEKYFKIGDRLKIGFESSTTKAIEFNKEEQQYLIDGEITAIEVHFTHTSEAHIVVRGYDVSHRLHRGRYNRSFLNQTDSDIVRKVVSEVGIKLGQIDNSGEPHDYVFQENQTNMEFLRERAARIGFELFIQDNKLNFRKPESKTSLNLKWLVDISSFSTRITSSEQVSSVEVRSWDYTQKKLITSIKKSEKLVTETGNGKGSSTSSKFNMGNPTMIVVDQPVFKPKEADTMAQALCDELGGEFVYADAKAEGNPEIRPGKVIQLDGMGDRYSGKYYVTETRHFYTQRVYKTEFSVRGLRGGSLLTTIASPVHLQPGQTLLVGIVTHNKDPKGWGRVKVKLPTLTEQDESNWARVVGLGAAINRGFYCLPEINDEVLVGFEHGDIHRPYIIGGVWNGKDDTPETVDDTINKNGKVRVRTIKTRTGHTIEFVEEDEQGAKEDVKEDGIYIHTAGGHYIRMNDRDTGPSQFVEIETSGGHIVRMDDLTSSKGISITTSGRHKIRLSDTPPKLIEIQTTAGQNLTLNDQGLNVTLQTEGTINIQAAMAVNVNAPAVTIEAVADINLAAAAAVSIEAAADINLAAAVAVSIEAPVINTIGLLLNNEQPVVVI
ncbi:MAG: VgrG-related protein [Rhizonema sp. NSF051]|nr:VgrG-related protein [Rhizonema sp. NSF051]